MSDNTQRPRSNGYDDLSDADIPTYSPRDNSQPLASDAPTTVFNPAASQPSQEQPTVALSFDQPEFNTAPIAGDTPTERVFEDARRGTIDFGIFLIRVAVGLYLIFHAIGVFFRLGNSAGLQGLEQAYGIYTYPSALAIAIPSAELAAGVFLLLGLMTPVAAAIGTVSAVFSFLHAITISQSRLNPFGAEETVALSALVLVVLVGLQFTGPGKMSLDFGRGWAQRPLVSSWVFAILGIAGAVALWWFAAAVNPLG